MRTQSWYVGIGAAIIAVALPAAAIASGAGNPEEYGAYIHAGTCSKIESRALFDIGDLEVERGPRAAEAAELPGSGPVYEGDEEISATLSELTASPHMVVVRERGDPSSQVIACGAIQGEISNDQLQTTLEPTGDSGVRGTALFRPNTDRDDNEPTEVIVRVRHGATDGS